jgi:hypothetical protein
MTWTRQPGIILSHHSEPFSSAAPVKPLTAQTLAVLLLSIDLSGRFKGKWHVAFAPPLTSPALAPLCS